MTNVISLYNEDMKTIRSHKLNNNKYIVYITTFGVDGEVISGEARAIEYDTEAEADKAADRLRSEEDQLIPRGPFKRVTLVDGHIPLSNDELAFVAEFPLPDDGTPDVSPRSLRIIVRADRDGNNRIALQICTPHNDQPYMILPYTPLSSGQTEELLYGVACAKTSVVFEAL